MNGISASLFVAATLSSFLALAADGPAALQKMTAAASAQADRQATPRRADCLIDQDRQAVRLLLIAHTLGRTQPACLSSPPSAAPAGLRAG